MQVQFTVRGQRWRADLGAGRCIGIPLCFGGPQPSAFGLPAATSRVVEAGSFVGDTRRGGGANCETVTLNPHGNGTHTECVGHILDERVPVAQALSGAPLLASVLTAPLVDEGEDRVVDAAALKGALEEAQPGFLEALVLRVRGVEASVDSRYTGQNPPYVGAQAMAVIRQAGVQHLLLELPSVDREEDAGALEAHHIFWSVPLGRHDYQGVAPQEEAQGRRRTITEMILLPEALEDGPWWLQLQIPGFMLDAAPSRPILYPVERVE